MLKENMEKILSEGYKKALLKRFRIPDYKGFGKLFESFDISEEELKNLLDKYVWGESKIDLIEFLIKELVYRDTGNELFSRSVYLESSIIDTPYYTYMRHTVRYKPKLSILEECSSEWVWKNYEKVCNFMDSDYKKLEGEFIDDD